MAASLPSMCATQGSNPGHARFRLSVGVSSVDPDSSVAKVLLPLEKLQTLQSAVKVLASRNRSLRAPAGSGPVGSLFQGGTVCPVSHLGFPGEILSRW